MKCLRLIACISSVFLVIFCLVSYGYKQSPYNFLPQDLLYNGFPIHPRYIVATQFGDSSRLEQKSLADKTKCVFGVEESNHTFSCDHATKTVVATCEFSYPWYEQNTDLCKESYQYIGSYKNKHIVITEHYDSSGTGHFTELGLIVRSGDMICNAGEITAGDRAYGGEIKIRAYPKIPAILKSL